MVEEELICNLQMFDGGLAFSKYNLKDMISSMIDNDQVSQFNDKVCFKYICMYTKY